MLRLLLTVITIVKKYTMILPNEVVPKELGSFIIAVAEMVNEVCLSIWIFGYEKTPCDRHLVWLIYVLRVYSYQNIIFLLYFVFYCVINIWGIQYRV